MRSSQPPGGDSGKPDAADLLRRIACLRGCSAAERRALAPVCRRTAYRAGQSIHAEHAPVQKVCAVLAGEVLIHRGSGDRRAARLAVVKPGEMFGIGEALLPSYYTSASALTACTLLEIGRGDFIRRFLAVASVREQILLELSQIARFLICQATGGGGRHDLALYLRSQANACGQADGGRICLKRKLRQPEIASLLHLSREHVSRLFARLRAEGAVDFNRGFPVIDRAWLDREAGDPDLAASVQYRDARIDL